MFPLHEPVIVPSQKDAIALALLLRLDDECLRSPFIKLLFEILGVLRQDPGLGEEVEVFWKDLLHHIQVFSQKFLVGQLLNVW